MRTILNIIAGEIKFRKTKDWQPWMAAEFLDVQGEILRAPPRRLACMAESPRHESKCHCSNLHHWPAQRHKIQQQPSQTGLIIFIVQEKGFLLVKKLETKGEESQAVKENQGKAAATEIPRVDTHMEDSTGQRGGHGRRGC